MVTVILARTPAQLDDFRTLVREFINWARATFHPNEVKLPPVFAKLEDELANLPGKYSEPDGAIFLAILDEKTVGCLASFRRDESSMEVTRLWVRPESRGHNVGEILVQHLLKNARTIGYERVVLRSHEDLKAAHKIYRNAGFRDMDGNTVFPEFAAIEVAMHINLT